MSIVSRRHSGHGLTLGTMYTEMTKSEANVKLRRYSNMSAVLGLITTSRVYTMQISRACHVRLSNPFISSLQPSLARMCHLEFSILSTATLFFPPQKINYVLHISAYGKRKPDVIKMTRMKPRNICENSPCMWSILVRVLKTKSGRVTENSLRKRHFYGNLSTNGICTLM